MQALHMSRPGCLRQRVCTPGARRCHLVKAAPRPQQALPQSVQAAARAVLVSLTLLASSSAARAAEAVNTDALWDTASANLLLAWAVFYSASAYNNFKRTRAAPSKAAAAAAVQQATQTQPPQQPQAPVVAPRAAQPAAPTAQAVVPATPALAATAAAEQPAVPPAAPVPQMAPAAASNSDHAAAVPVPQPAASPKQVHKGFFAAKAEELQASQAEAAATSVSAEPAIAAAEPAIAAAVGHVPMPEPDLSMAVQPATPSPTDAAAQYEAKLNTVWQEAAQRQARESQLLRQREQQLAAMRPAVQAEAVTAPDFQLKRVEPVSLVASQDPAPLAALAKMLEVVSSSLEVAFKRLLGILAALKLPNRDRSTPVAA